MKAARCIAKIVAALIIVGAAAALIVRYWDRIVDLFYVVVGKIKDKKEEYCCAFPSEYNDFDDECAADLVNGDPL